MINEILKYMEYPAESKRKHSDNKKYAHLMNEKTVLPLSENGHKFYFYNSEALNSCIADLSNTLKDIRFADKSVKYLHFSEMQSSLAIEGYKFPINKISSDIKYKNGIVFSMKQAYDLGISNPKISTSNLIAIFNIMQTYKESDTESGFRVNDVFISDSINYRVMAKPSTIKPRVDELFSFINSSKLNPFIISFVSHYVYEKIHPFYDFNGRTGRLLMNMVFANKTDKTIPLLSQSIYAFKNKYYKSFDNCGDFDLTGFIINIIVGLYKFYSAYERALKNNLSPSLESLLVKIYLMDKKTFTIYELKRGLNIFEKRASMHEKLKQLVSKGILKVCKEKTSKYILV